MTPNADMQIGRRAAPRVRVYLPATLMLTNRSVNCIIENISTGGARLHLADLPRVRSDAFLMCGGLEIFSVVVWVKGHRCGLFFEDELSPDAVVAIRRFSDEYAERVRQQAESQEEPWPPAGHGKPRVPRTRS